MSIDKKITIGDKGVVSHNLVTYGLRQTEICSLKFVDRLPITEYHYLIEKVPIQGFMVPKVAY